MFSTWPTSIVSQAPCSARLVARRQRYLPRWQKTSTPSSTWRFFRTASRAPIWTNSSNGLISMSTAWTSSHSRRAVPLSQLAPVLACRQRLVVGTLGPIAESSNALGDRGVTAISYNVAPLPSPDGSLTVRGAARVYLHPHRDDAANGAARPRSLGTERR